MTFFINLRPITTNFRLSHPSAYYTCLVLSGCANSFVVTQHHNCVTRSCARDMLEKKDARPQKKVERNQPAKTLSASAIQLCKSRQHDRSSALVPFRNIELLNSKTFCRCVPLTVSIDESSRVVLLFWMLLL